MRSFATLLLVVVLCAGRPSASPQQQAAPAPLSAQPPAPFRSATALVEVDVIVKDKDGRFVSGLTADDFEVLEEGRPQHIQHFYLVTEQASAVGEPRSAVMTPRSPDQTERRVFVLFFDTDHLAAGSIARVKEAARTFVGAQFKPGDLGGVFANGTLWHGRLTTDSQELLDGIRNVMPAIETSASRREQLIQYPRIGSEIEAVRVEEGDQHTLDALADQNCLQERANCEMEGGREYVVVKLQRKAQIYVDLSRRAASSTLQTLAYLSKNLSGLEGRKTVVMLSEGFFTPDVRSELPIIAGKASRAGVTIYTVDARGTAGAGGRTVADASVPLGSLSMIGDTSEEGLNLLATETGGLPIRHTDDLASALNTVASDTSTYYVLAYSSDNATLDGRYRKIDLRTTWKGLSIRARAGYVATPLPTPRQVRPGRP